MKKKVVSKVGTTMVVVMVVAAAKLADWRPAGAAGSGQQAVWLEAGVEDQVPSSRPPPPH